MGLKIYLDSCLIIYLIEEHQIFNPILENQIAKYSNPLFAASHLSEMECIVMPLRNQNSILVQKFKNWFQQIEMFEYKQVIFHQAAQLRADFPSLKTPDALHLATAIHHKCDEFWTNDNRLDKIAPNLVKKIV